MHRHFIAILSLLAIALMAHETASDQALAQSKNDIEINRVLVSARSSFRKRDWASAIRDYSRYLEAIPGAESARFERSQAFRILGQYEQAIRDLSYLLKQKKGPTPPEEIEISRLYYFRGSIYYDMGEEDLALDDFKKSCEGEYFLPRPFTRLLINKLELKKTWQGLTIDKRAQQPTANPLVEEAKKKYETGHFREAYRLFSDAINRYPNLSQAYLGRGMVAEAQDDIDGARADYTSAILIDPYNAEAFYRRAKTYESSNQDFAIADHQQACLLGRSASCRYLREAAEIWEGRGIVFLRADNFKRARESFEKAMEIDIVYADLYFNRALTWSKTNHPMKAIEDWETYIAYAKSFKVPAAVYGDAYFNIGLNYYRNGQRQQAIEAYTQAIAHDRRNAPKNLVRDLHHRAKVYYEFKDDPNKRKALHDLREACRMGDRLSCDMMRTIARELGVKE